MTTEKKRLGEELRQHGYVPVEQWPSDLFASRFTNNVRYAVVAAAGSPSALEVHVFVRTDGTYIVRAATDYPEYARAAEAILARYTPAEVLSWADAQNI